MPCPVLEGNKKHFKKFDELYGTCPTEADRPSLKFSLDASKEDKDNKVLMVSSKVRDVITCSQCSKPRCIYTMAKITDEKQKIELKRKKEEKSYSYGEPLFHEDHSMRKVMVVRQ